MLTPDLVGVAQGSHAFLGFGIDRARRFRRRALSIDDLMGLGSLTPEIAQFVTGPFQNALAHDEVAVEAVIPAPKGTVAGGYLKLERRVGDFATAGAAVALEMSGAVVTRAGIALTGVGGSTIDAADAAHALVGGPLTADSIGRAADLAAQAAQPRTDHRGSADYKRHIVRTFVERILTRVAQPTERAA